MKLIFIKDYSFEALAEIQKNHAKTQHIALRLKNTRILQVSARASFIKGTSKN